MPKFMIKASYAAEGIRGLLKEGGTGRRAAVQKVVESVGGKMEAFYFAYGDSDAYVIVDVPDAATGIALSLAVNASGAVRRLHDSSHHTGGNGRGVEEIDAVSSAWRVRPGNSGGCFDTTRGGA